MAHERQGLARWLLACAVRYVPVFAVGWAASGAVAPRLAEPGNPDFSAKLPFWDSFLGYLEAGPGMLAGVGGVTLFLLMFISRQRHGDVVPFRVIASLLALVPTLIFLFFGSGLILLCMVLTQLAFTVLVMPAPGPGVNASSRRRWSTAEL